MKKSEKLKEILRKYNDNEDQDFLVLAYDFNNKKMLNSMKEEVKIYG